MQRLSLATATAIGLAVAAIMLTTPRPAEASIHEIIAALCRAGGEEVVPFGQNKAGNSFLRALMATGFITSIESTATTLTINFDPTVPNSKFRSTGSNVSFSFAAEAFWTYTVQFNEALGGDRRHRGDPLLDLVTHSP